MNTKIIAGKIADSWFLRKGKYWHEQYAGDWEMGGSLVRKAMATTYLIFKDYSVGLYPPKRDTQEKTFQMERSQFDNITHMSKEGIGALMMRKPFSLPGRASYMLGLNYLIEMLEARGIREGGRILELGCGNGWMAEMLALQGYDVVGVTLAPCDVDDGNRRVESLKVKGIKQSLKFVEGSMEGVKDNSQLQSEKPFDAVFCYEALHHAHDWNETLSAAMFRLKPGGWLLICGEPSSLHTVLCYRSGTMLKTQEIGMSSFKIKRYLKNIGFDSIECRWPLFGKTYCGLAKLLPVGFGSGALSSRPFWISARKTTPVHS